jgi:hypothetical protein
LKENLEEKDHQILDELLGEDDYTDEEKQNL